MSYHHDYYADPTLFDRCHALLADRARRLLQRTRPYYWGWGFALVASLCYLSVALIVAEMAVAGAAVAVGAAWPQSLASSIGALMALGGGTFFQRLARAALPAPPGPKPRKAAAPPRPRPAATAPGRAEVQQFFREVRAAGVNVSIARALFAAGIRTVAQVRGCDDRELLRIHGVGPATVRRLRARFNRPA
ncbi:MAG TPA: helix-hairpin-helix domain-containing protein [Gammaproteobacteria bacterium]|nr:helix-hairpin-helix domain-containing protein [Gammaproteobacteria bacterium]